MILEAKGDYDGALQAYNNSRAVAKPFDWQPVYRMWRLLSSLGKVDAAAELRRALVRLWGEDQFAWYSTDVDGELIRYIDTAERSSRVDGGVLRAHI